MKKGLLKISLASMLFSLAACDKVDDFVGGGDDESKKLTYIDEFVLPDGEMFEGTVVGGLSGIDYANGKWYMISDDPVAPIRFYTASISYDIHGFNTLEVEAVTELKDRQGSSFAENTVDPEAIRFTRGGSIAWTSEGNITNGIDPFIWTSSLEGDFVASATLDEKFQVSSDDTTGPRQNGTFEGLSLSYNGMGYWASMELPLVQDGPAPTVEDTESPVRIAYINSATGAFGKEFAYELDPVVRQFDESAFIINGIVEILEYDIDKFLVLERSFSTGFDDGGNDVKIYDVDASNATDVSGLESLDGQQYTKATKTLLFDFETIRDQLTEGIVDNIEGIAFGPDFENGHKSLVLVADNNFSAFGPQLNQFVLFELED